MRETATPLRGLSLRSRPDVELVDAAIAGNPSAFAELYRRHHTSVYAFCLSRLLNPTAAEDAAQETFIRLFSARPGTIEKPLSWLFGVARHVCIDVARRADREPATDLSAQDLPDLFSTEGHVTARDDAQRIAIALGSLNPRYRTALVMHEMHAQSALDIAKAFKIGLGATYTLLSRARDAFSAAYERTEQMPEPCRRANALLYRRAADSTTDAENALLEQHLAGCGSCRREARRFARSKRAAALRGALLMPFASPLWSRLQHGLEPLAARLGPDITHAVAVSVAATLATVGVVAIVSTVPPNPVRHEAVGVNPNAQAAVRAEQTLSAQAATHDRTQLLAHRYERARAQYDEAERVSGTKVRSGRLDDTPVGSGRVTGNAGDGPVAAHGDSTRGSGSTDRPESGSGSPDQSAPEGHGGAGTEGQGSQAGRAKKDESRQALDGGTLSAP